MSWLRLVLCAVLLQLGCDGLGRAVVGEHLPPGLPDLCKKPLACAALELEPPGAVPDVIEPVDLAKCTRAAVALCPSASVSGGGHCPAPSLDLSLTLSEAEGNPELQALSCRAVKLMRAEADASTMQIELSAWTDVKLELESVEPMTLELSGGKLEHVSLELHGPITLRLIDVSQGNDVRVLADNGRAHIELVRTTLRGLVLSVPEGEVLLRRSVLQNVAVWAERVDLESSFVRDTTWQTASLNAADSTLTRVRSEAQRSVLSACNVKMMSFLACQSLSTIQGTYDYVQMSACAEEAAIYGSDVTHAQIEGDLILDRAGLYDAVLGVGEVGAIKAWDSKLADISFCSDQQALSIGGMSLSHCAHCDLTPEPSEPDACLVESGFLRATKSESCPSLDLPPICGDPQPQRMRPPLN